MTNFSIIVAAYNCDTHLKQCVDSISDQDYDSFEVIIVNDGSTDNTDRVARELQKTYRARLKYVYQNNKGVSSARNTGASYANGDYFLFLDADDRLLPHALEKFAIAIHSNIRTKVFIGAHKTISEAGSVKNRKVASLYLTKESNFIAYLRKEFSLPNGSYILHRSIFDTFKFREDIKNYEDVILLAQILSKHIPVAIDSPIVEIYKHSDSLRNLLDVEKHSSDKIVDLLFDSRVIPSALFKCISEYKSLHSLSLFRQCYLRRHFVLAKKYYTDAIRHYPRNILNYKYLKKYLRMAFA